MKAFRQWWNVSTCVFVTMFLALMAIGPTSLFHDPGTFWHIRVGEVILDSRELVRTDSFSSTFRGQPWLASQWLAECLMAVLDRLGGFDTILLVTAASLAVFYAWVASRLSARGLQWPVTILLLTLCLAGSSYHFLPRPHLVTIFFMGWMFARLCDFEAWRVPLSRLFVFVPVIALWTNLHGGVIAGLITLGICGGGWTLEALAGRPSPLARMGSFAAFAVLCLFCLLAPLGNPYGIELPRVWFTVMSLPVLPQLMIEHAPIDLADPVGRSVAFLGLVYAAACAGVPLRSFRTTWLVPLLWFVLAWTRIRHGPIFAVTAVIALAEMFPHIRWIEWLTRRGSELLVVRPDSQANLPPRFDAKLAIAAMVLVGATFSLQMARVPLPVLGHGWAKLDPKYWPVDLLPELEAYQREHLPGTPIFNEMLFGGFLIYFTPGLGVFIDDRCELYGNEALDEYRRALGGDQRIFESWTTRYGFDLALAVPGSQFESYLRGSSKWAAVKETLPAILFRRQ